MILPELSRIEGRLARPFIKPSVAQPLAPLFQRPISSYLFTAIPAIDLPNSVVLTPASYGSWSSMFSANSSKKQFLLTPGDYRSWGAIDTYNRVFGSDGDYKVIRYYGVDSGTHPVLRASNRQAFVDAVKITGPNSHHLVVQGLWIDNPSVNCGASLEAHHIVFDFNVLQNAEIYGLRMNATQWSGVQRNVIRDLRQGGTLGGDMIGVQFKNADTLPASEFPTINNWVVHNQISNTGDCIGFTEAVTLFQPVQAVIECNDGYIDPSEYIGDTNTSPHENFLDLKAGSDDLQTIVRWNYAWGFRRNDIPSALGEVYVVQKYARNILLAYNFTDDAPRGMKDENWPTGKKLMTVDHTTDTFTSNDHHLGSGDGAINLVPDSGGTVPAGAALATRYWAIYVDEDHFKIATSRANALAGIAVALSSNGTGTLRWKVDSTMSRNVQWVENEWTRIRDKATADVGAVYKPITDMSFAGEMLALCDFAFDISPSTYYGPTFEDFTLSEVDAIQRPEDQTPALPFVPANHNILGTPPNGYERYERKQWTGPEIAYRAKPWNP